MKLDQTDVTVFTKSAAVKVNYISLITTSVEIIPLKVIRVPR